MKNINSNCPVCDGAITLPSNTELTEVVSCSECRTRLVVNAIEGERATLSQAPDIEEDWGE